MYLKNFVAWRDGNPSVSNPRWLAYAHYFRNIELSNNFVLYHLHGYHNTTNSVGGYYISNHYDFVVIRRKDDTAFSLNCRSTQRSFTTLENDLPFTDIMPWFNSEDENESLNVTTPSDKGYKIFTLTGSIFTDVLNTLSYYFDTDIETKEYVYNGNGDVIPTVADSLVSASDVESVDFQGGVIVDNTPYESAYHDTFNYINFSNRYANEIVRFRTTGSYIDNVKGYIVSIVEEPHTYYFGVGIKDISNSGDIEQGGYIFNNMDNTYNDVSLTQYSVNSNNCTLLKGNHYVNTNSMMILSLDVDINLVSIQNNRKYINPNELEVTFLQFATTDDYLLWLTNDETSPTPTDITDDIPTDDTPTDDTPTDDYSNDDMDINDIDVAPSNLTKMYKMTSANVENLSIFLWNSPDNVYESIVKNLALQGANPLDAIISLRLFPFDLDNVLTLSQMLTDVSIGRITATDAKGYKVVSIHPKIHLCDFTIDRHYNTFMDYDPYSQYYLYLPFYSTIPLSTKDFLNKNISIDLVVDVINGVANYLISVNGTIIKTLNCKIAIDIPLSAVDDRQRSNQFINSIMGVGVSAVGLASGNPIAISTGIAQTLASDFINQNGMSSIINGGLQGSYLNIINPLDIYLLQTHSVYSEPINYNYQIGYPCESNYKLSSISGKIWVDNADFNNVPCTEVEKNELRNLFKNGVVWY